MIINEQYQGLSLLESEKYRFIGRDGRILEESEELLKEHFLEVYVNEVLTMKLICLSSHLSELVLGRLLTEGIIADASDVEQIYICEYGTRARVILRSDVSTVSDSQTPGDFIETTPTCCTGNHILTDRFAHRKALSPVTPIHWQPEWIFALADRFADGTPLHEKTWATHSCFLAQGEEFLFSCEDIGRHNALDKVIGYALRHGIDLRQCIVYSSGRIPTDMVQKAIQAGIPVLASKASPTSEAISLARENQMTLICAARRDRMKVFCDRKVSF